MTPWGAPLYTLGMSIKKLSDTTISQIAAGEVVERPAHMVKELVENALDAGARRIAVDLDEGGRFVQVVDDGKGIAADQMPLVFERHATSKLSEIDDLWKLSSFGFRGEALASLAAVSRAHIISHPPGAETAHRLDVEFGQMHEVTPSSGARGTRIVIQDLFENLPARKKFLKSEAAEISQIRNVLKALAMMHPEVEFKVRHKGQLLHNWPAAGSLERVQAVLGVEPLYFEQAERGSFQVKVYFGSPHQVMRQNRGIWIFAQKRWVLDRGLQAAVMDAYHSLLMHREYPYCVVDLVCPPDEIDVNVHPTKSQVKFRDASSAFRAVRSSLRQGLERAPWIPKGSPVEAASPSSPRPPSSGPLYEPSAPSQPLHFKEPEFYRTQFQQKQSLARPGEEIFSALKNLTPLEAPGGEPLVDSDVPEARGFWSSLQVLGQSNLTYIVAQNDRALLLVDQHAAHERVKYESLWKSYSENAMASQRLLVPLVLDLPQERAEAVWEVRGELEKLAVELEWTGPETLALLSRPVLINEAALVEALVSFAAELTEKGGSISVEKHLAHAMATMACHSSIRAGQALSQEQMQNLLRQMDEFPLSSFCPHGRPVSVEYTFHELEKDFGRIV